MSRAIYASISYVAFGFFLLFSGHSAFRSLLPAIRPASGPWLVALNFFAYAIGSLLHPRWLSKYRRFFFTLAALAHAQWISLLQAPIEDAGSNENSDLNRFYVALASISSIVNGFGAGLLWATQGAWISDQIQRETECKTSNSRYTSIFLFFYGISGLFGNTFAAITLKSGILVQSTVWYLFAASLAGAFWFLFTPESHLYAEKHVFTQKVISAVDFDLGYESAYSSSSSNSSSSSSISSSFGINHMDENYLAKNNIVADHSAGCLPDTRWSLIKTLFTDTVFPCLIPSIICLSAVSALIWVSLPLLLDIADVPIAFSLYAVGSAFGPLLASRINFLISYVSSVTLGLLLIGVGISGYFYEWRGFWLAVSFIFGGGFIVGALNNIIYACMTKKITFLHAQQETKLSANLQPHLAGEAFCVHGFFYCVFFALFSSLTLILQPAYLAIIVGFFFLANAPFCVDFF